MRNVCLFYYDDWGRYKEGKKKKLHTFRLAQKVLYKVKASLRSGRNPQSFPLCDRLKIHAKRCIKARTFNFGVYISYNHTNDFYKFHCYSMTDLKVMQEMRV